MGWTPDFEQRAKKGDLTVGIIGLGFMAPKIIMTKSVSAAHAAYWAYAGLFGLWLAPIFMYYTSTSIVRVFFITAAAFAGLSLYGYVTKKNLSAMGSFLMMGVIGIFIAIIVNCMLIIPLFKLTIINFLIQLIKGTTFKNNT